MGSLSIPGLSPGSLRYTSGVRGSLQHRSRRGSGRRRRQLQPDACRVLHHRSAGSLSFLLFQAFPCSATFYCSSPSHFLGGTQCFMEWSYSGVYSSHPFLSFSSISLLKKPHPGLPWFGSLVSLTRAASIWATSGKENVNEKEV